MYLPVPPNPEKQQPDSAEKSPVQTARPGSSVEGQADRWHPMQHLTSCPVTALIALAAAWATVRFWRGGDVAAFFMDGRVRFGEIWRPLSATLIHVDIAHLAFNLYWLFVLGVLVESAFGSLAMLGLSGLLAFGSSSAQYLLSSGGVGLSGVGYGLFGLLFVLRSRDRRFAQVLNSTNIAAFSIWFVMCWVLTALDLWRVGNIAHASGCLLGSLVGFVIKAQGSRRVALEILLASILCLLFLGDCLKPFGAQELAVLAFQDLAAGRNEDAAEKLERVTALDPGQGYNWYNLGVALSRLGKFEAAAGAFDSALAAGFQDPSFKRDVAKIKARQAYQKQKAGDAKEACRLYETALELDPKQASWWYYLGTAQLGVGSVDAAREAFRKAAVLDPGVEQYKQALKNLPEGRQTPK